ncbi:MAG: hypothetical protein M1482_17770 [Chloroflexi bacterium]|nr:hypothetical protein [Chloroflexota bacterium]
MTHSQEKAAARFETEVRQLEERLAVQNPGVQAVMETYAQAQASLQQVDAYVRMLNPRPTILTSNGSAPTP